MDKDAIMRAEAKIAISKWQTHTEKNGDGKAKKFEKSKLLASQVLITFTFLIALRLTLLLLSFPALFLYILLQMTAASEMSRIHHEVLIGDLLAFGEQCESYFTPSLSSVPPSPLSFIILLYLSIPPLNHV